MAEFLFQTQDDKALRLTQHVADGEDAERNISFDLTTTMGLGGLKLILTVRRGSASMTEMADLRKPIEEWVEVLAGRLSLDQEVKDG